MAEKHEKSNVSIKIENDRENDNNQNFWRKNNCALARAKNGLNDATELAYTLQLSTILIGILLYNSSEIANTSFRKMGRKNL